MKDQVTRSGAGAMTHEQMSILLACALQPSRPPLSGAIRLAGSIAAERGMPFPCSETTCRRQLREWKAGNYSLWVYLREGYQAWRAKIGGDIEVVRASARATLNAAFGPATLIEAR